MLFNLLYVVLNFLVPVRQPYNYGLKFIDLALQWTSTQFP